MKSYQTILTISALLLTQYSMAQSNQTIISTTVQPDGTEVRTITQQPLPLESAVFSFAQADVNQDGCVDTQEAKDAGILRMATFAKTRAGCLNQAEYEAAITSPTF